MPEESESAFIHMPLKSLVDLVINSPSNGMVNFHILHTILHVLIHQMNLSGLSVELHGPEADRLNKLIKGDFVAATMSVQGSAKEGERELVVVDPILKSSGEMSAVTSDKLDNLLLEVEKIKSKVVEIEEMPSNFQLIEATRTDSGKTPVADMCHIVNIIKRLDAAEIGMQKLAGIVEEAIKNPLVCASPVKEKIKRSRTEESGTAPKRASKARIKKEKSVTITNKASGGEVIKTENRALPTETDVEDRENFLQTMEDTIEDMIDQKLEMMRELGTQGKSDTLKELTEDVKKLKDILFKKKSTDLDDTTTDDTKIESALPPDVQLAVLEEQFKEYTIQLQRMDDSFNNELTRLHHQFTDIERDFNEILLKIQSGLPSGDAGLNEPNQCCTMVFQKIVKLEGELDVLTDASTKLMDDKDEKSKKMDEMLEQIEMLKVLKADKEEMEEALADKADTCAVHRKVSHVQFEGACDELSKGIEDALEKLTQQEILWQHALQEIQSEIGSKLDKMDLGPLREFINNKLRMLQEKMKSLAALKKEQEAAGTKSRFLRNVNCISCDKNVVMRKEMDSTMRPAVKTHPPTRSIAPYLAYELDALRKQQKALPGSKNLNQIEAALGMGKIQKGQQDHICNRYCGGSHTVTTPQQRVTRLGHFLMQWGPEAIPVVEETVITKELEVKKSLTGAKPAPSALLVSKSAMEIKNQGKVEQRPSSGKRASTALTTSKSVIAVGEKKPSRLEARRSSIKQPSVTERPKVQEETIPEVAGEEVEPSEVGEVTEPAETVQDEVPPPSEVEEIAEAPPELDVPPEVEAPPAAEPEEPEDAPEE